METREEVERTSDTIHLHLLRSRNCERQDALYSQLDACFVRGDQLTAKNLATELIYLVKLEQAITEKLS